LQELESKLIRIMEFKIPPLRQGFDESRGQMDRAIWRRLADRRGQNERLAAALEALSPLKVLGRGYTLIQGDSSQNLVKSSKDVHPGERVKLVFHDGTVPAQILKETH
jgi:exodeoxyribonuclease VII large subunit